MRYLPILAVALGTFSALGAQAADPMDKSLRITTAKDYVSHAAVGDLFEVQSSNIALTRSADKGVKDFAQMMVRDHTDSTNKIKAAIVGHSELAPPAKLDAAHEALLKQLRDADKASFDRLYMDMQMKGHGDALTLHEAYAASGDNAALRKVAADIVPVVKKHMDHLQMMTAGEPAPTAPLR